MSGKASTVRGGPDECLEAEGLYGYLRASGMLREVVEDWEFSEWHEKVPGLGGALSGEGLFFFLLLEQLQSAEFPAPWEELSEAGRAELVSLLCSLVGPAVGRKRKLSPPAVIVPWPEEEPSLNCLPFEWSLFKDFSGEECFPAFLLINRGSTEKEVLEAIRGAVRKHCPRKRGGGSARWQAKLNDLAVLRICARFPDDPIKRVTEIARLSPGFKGCKAYAEERHRAKREGREVDRRISNAAEVEMSRACARARAFFQTLFPGEEPLSD
jgi:hypothetical protein